MKIVIINKVTSYNQSLRKNYLLMRKSDKYSKTGFSYFCGMVKIRHYQIPLRYPIILSDDLTKLSKCLYLIYLIQFQTLVVFLLRKKAVCAFLN